MYLRSCPFFLLWNQPPLLTSYALHYVHHTLIKNENLIMNNVRYANLPTASLHFRRLPFLGCRHLFAMEIYACLLIRPILLPVNVMDDLASPLPYLST